MSLSKKLEVDAVLPLMRTMMSMVNTIEFEYYDDFESLTLSLVAMFSYIALLVNSLVLVTVSL